MKEAELLGTVSRAIGDVQVERDPGDFLSQASLLANDQSIQQGAAKAMEHSRSPLVFELGDRGLGGQGIAGDRIPTQQELVDGVVTETSGVVGIGVSAGDPVNPLLQKLSKRVVDLAGLARVVE